MLLRGFHQSFSNSVSIDDFRRIFEHMVKLKGRSSIKIYLRIKSIKFGCKFWYHNASEIRCLYQFDLYLGKKNGRRTSGTRCCFEDDLILSNQSKFFFFFDNFFNSPSLMVKIYETSLYAIGTVRKDRNRMLEMTFERQMKRVNFEYMYSCKVACSKWLNRHSATMLFRIVKRMAIISTVQCS